MQSLAGQLLRPNSLSSTIREKKAVPRVDDPRSGRRSALKVSGFAARSARSTYPRCPSDRWWNDRSDRRFAVAKGVVKSGSAGGAQSERLCRWKFSIVLATLEQEGESMIRGVDGVARRPYQFYFFLGSFFAGFSAFFASPGR